MFSGKTEYYFFSFFIHLEYLFSILTTVFYLFDKIDFAIDTLKITNLNQK